MPVVRNSQYYFKEGFCWSDISDERIRTRLKNKSIHDVKSMSLFSILNETSDSYLVSLLNSSLIGGYIKVFINNTISFQINDARQIPIIIPTKKELEEFEELFNLAFKIKKAATDKEISSDKSENQLLEIQEKLDTMVNELYFI